MLKVLSIDAFFFLDSLVGDASSKLIKLKVARRHFRIITTKIHFLLQICKNVSFLNDMRANYLLLFLLHVDVSSE